MIDETVTEIPVAPYIIVKMRDGHVFQLNTGEMAGMQIPPAALYYKVLEAFGVEALFGSEAPLTQEEMMDNMASYGALKLAKGTLQ